MRIIQLLPVLAYGDAIGNDTIALHKAMQEKGYNAEIFASVIDSRIPFGMAKSVDEIGEIGEKDIIIYHLSTGHELNNFMKTVNCIRVVVYHNITPSNYFAGYSVEAKLACEKGRESAKELAEFTDFAIADSEYNKQELVDYGYKCPIAVVPILIPFDDYKTKPDTSVINKYKDDYVNILFTGRVVPNKKHEDLIDTFYYYKKYINPKSRLILVGSFAGIDLYHEELAAYVEALGLSDVVFTGHIKFNQILSFYSVADVFLCMSEHEGFCVPLLEAMCFNVPVIARDTSAIAGTLGGSGLLLNDNNPMVAAEAINKVMNDDLLRNQIIDNQNLRLKDFDNETVKVQFLDVLEELIRSKN